MWPTSVDGSATNNHVFSECSRYLANQAIVGNSQDKCLTLPTGGICGNGLVEEGEECDCGASLGEGIAKGTDAWNLARDFCQSNPDNFNRDSCCLPDCMLDASNEGKRADGPAQCTPKKGECCGKEAPSMCRLTGYDESDIDTSTLSLTSAALQRSDAAEKKLKFACREEEECTEEGFCIQSAAYHGVCPYTSLTAFAMAANTTIKADAFLDERAKLYKSDSVICAGGAKTCKRGECSGDLCRAFKYIDGQGEVTPIRCSNPNELEVCHVSCSFNRNQSDCISTLQLFSNITDFDTSILIRSDLQGAFKQAGDLCNSNRGFCDVTGTCVAPSTLSPTDLLGAIDAGWVWQNWYWVLAFEAGVASIAFMMRCGHESRLVGTKRFVKNRLQGEEFSQTIQRLAFKKSTRKRGENKTQFDQKVKRDSVWREIAVLEAEGEHLRRKSQIFGGEKKKDLHGALARVFD
jgi:disintegrin and metalloproteinase domain-containing protein 10